MSRPITPFLFYSEFREINKIGNKLLSGLKCDTSIENNPPSFGPAPPSQVLCGRGILFTKRYVLNSMQFKYVVH